MCHAEKVYVLMRMLQKRSLKCPGQPRVKADSFVCKVTRCTRRVLLAFWMQELIRPFDTQTPCYDTDLLNLFSVASNFNGRTTQIGYHGSGIHLIQWMRGAIEEQPS